jgi:hypothetical protein
MPTPEARAETPRPGRIVLLTPEEARVAAKEQGQENLSAVGRRVFKQLAAQVVNSEGKPFSFSVDREYPNSPGYGLTAVDIRVMTNEARNSRWNLKVERTSSPEGYGEGAWWALKGTPMTAEEAQSVTG